jgi:uncharacterized protein
MIGLGTIVNVIAILVGSLIGILIKGGLKQRFKETIMNALGLAVMFIGISGALKGIYTVKENSLDTNYIMLMTVSLALGAFLGELINIEEKLEKSGEFIRTRLNVKGEKGQHFVDGFVDSSLLFCVGAMAIIGSLQDGLSGNPSMLIAKGFIDGVVAIFFASTLGIGVFFSAIPIAIYQGGITLSARFIGPFLTDQLISNISFIGSILIFGIGINMIFGKKIKCGNILPAVLIPVFYEMLKAFFK